jgi:plasmid maintenance system antidote protein VapI
MVVVKRGFKIMTNYALEKRKILFDVIFAVEGLKAAQIAKIIHVHRSHVSRHISGERTCLAVDVYLIETIFGSDIWERVRNGQ